MLYLNDMIVTKNGETAVVLAIDDVGIYIEYINGKRKGWQDYISVFDIESVDHTY